MSYNIADIKSRLSGFYQRVIKNIISLGDDSTLESDLKPLKVGEKNTPIELSESEVNVRGTINAEAINVKGSAVQTGTDAGATQLSELSDVTYSSGDLTISSLDTIISGALVIDSSGKISLDSTNDSGGIIDGTTFKTAGTEFAAITSHHALSCFTLYEAGGSSTDDYFAITTDAAGATTISTKDAAGVAGHLTLNPDGLIYLSKSTNLASGAKLYLDGGGDTFIVEESADLVTFQVGGAALLGILEDATTSTAQSSKVFTGCPILLKDLGGVADTPNSGYGSIYVNGDELAFKNDGGTAINGIGKYHYDLRVTNFYSSLTNVMIPLAGYIAEMSPNSSTGGVNTGQGEYVSLHAPYNGTVERIMFRSEAAQNGDLIFRIYEASDGTELAGTETCQKTTAINIADDTSVTVDFDSVDSGDNIVDKGKVYAIKVTTPSAMYDVFITVVFKWDTTS